MHALRDVGIHRINAEGLNPPKAPVAGIGHDERMDVRHQVFVSSTYTDLVDERREVIQALLELDCIPAGMEMFPAANEEQWELIRSVIDSSDYYIVIVGGRYGSVTADGISYTEKEYDYAVERGVPIVGFVHADPDAITRGKSELDTKAARRLEAFRTKVKSRMVKTYTDPASLGSVVSRSLVALMRKHPRPGWVRGEKAMSAETRAEIAELRAQVADYERASMTSQQAASEPDQSLAQGDDNVDLAYGYWSNSYGVDDQYSGSWTVTWDEIMAVLGPMMIDEASEKAVREKLDNTALTELWSSKGWKRLSSPRLQITDVSWAEVIVQLRALGYVETGVKKRQIADRATYWRVTAAGDAHLVSLLAARRAPH